METTLTFPELSPWPEEEQQKTAADVAQTTAVTAASRTAIDITKVDLADVALAQFGDWRTDIKTAAASIKDVTWDVSTAKGLADIISVRQRVTRAPQAAANKTADALVGKLTQVGKMVRAEQVMIVEAYKELGLPLTEIVDARETEIEAEKQRKAAVEAARKAAHEANIATLRAYAEHAVGKTAAQIAAGIAAVEAIAIGDAWQEYAARAEATKLATLVSLVALHDKARAAEAAAVDLLLRKAEADRVAAEQAAEAKRLNDVALALAAQQRDAAEKLAREQVEFAARVAAFEVEEAKRVRILAEEQAKAEAFVEALPQVAPEPVAATQAPALPAEPPAAPIPATTEPVLAVDQPKRVIDAAALARQFGKWDGCRYWHFTPDGLLALIDAAGAT